MPTLSAFADEISPDFKEQLDTLEVCGIKHIDLRGVWNRSVMDLRDAELKDLVKQAGDRGVKFYAVGSPIGKTRIDQPAQLELDRVKRALDIAQVIGASTIRIFSFYPPEGKTIGEFGDEVIRRMRSWVELVEREKRPVVLVHENESGIYGDIPERCERLMKELYGPKLVACHDPANYVHSGVSHVFETCFVPLKKYIKQFHLKDYQPGQGVVPCGAGTGDVEKTLAAAYRDGFTGVMTMEPHLSKASQFQGFSGPDRFKAAVDAVRAICRNSGIPLD